MFYSYSRGEQRKALHTETHPDAVVRRFKIDLGTNGQQEQRSLFISVNGAHIHHHESTRSAAAALAPLWVLTASLFISYAELIVNN